MSDELGSPDDNWAYSDGQRDGAENEREAIVAWLRRHDVHYDCYSAKKVASDIERGEHLRGDDE